MPYIDDDKMPSFLNKSTPIAPKNDPLGQKNAVEKPLHYGQEKPHSESQVPDEKKDESLFHGESQVSRYKFEKSLTKNREIREKLAKELKIRPYSPEMEDAIKDMKERVPKIFGGYIDKAEAQRLEKRQYWDEKKELREIQKEGVTWQESKQIAKGKIKNSFLKRLFGMGEK